MGTRWGVTKERDGTELVGKGCCVHYDLYKIKKKVMQRGRKAGGSRVSFESQMMVSRGALSSKDL